jgi:ketosteroid isomerase-like protein
MPTPSKTLVDLETRFWQSMVDQDAETAVAMLSEPAVMVSSHGAFQFDHDGYRKMAGQDAMVLTSFEFSDMEVVFPNETTAVVTYSVKQGVKSKDASGTTSREMHDSSTWIKDGDSWKCVMHTETPAQPQSAKAQ